MQVQQLRQNFLVLHPCIRVSQEDELFLNSSLRYILGDIPYFFLKRRLKYERLVKPVSYDISSTGLSVVESRVHAIESRQLFRYSVNVHPICFLKNFIKCDVLKLAASAASEGATGSLQCMEIQQSISFNLAACLFTGFWELMSTRFVKSSEKNWKR